MKPRVGSGVFAGVFWWLLLWTTNAAAIAQSECQPDTVVNRVAAEFHGAKEKVPQSLELVSDGTQQKLRIQVVRQGNGLWTNESTLPLVGGEHQLVPSLTIPGYSILRVRGVNRSIGSKCYAFFSFEVKKTSWTLHVLIDPEFPFEYKRKGKTFPCTPKSGDYTWNLVEGLSLEDRIGLKIYEMEGDKRIFLFSLDSFEYSQLKELDHNKDRIVERILEQRTPYKHVGKDQWPKDLSPDDPYIKIAIGRKTSQSGPGDELAKKIVKDRLALDSLRLRDKTEVNQ